MAIASDFVGAGRAQLGLRRYMTLVHLTVAGALVTSALSALLVTANPRVHSLLFTPTGLSILGWVVVLAPLVIVTFFGSAVERMTVAGARLLLLIFAILIGASLASVFSAYTSASILLSFVAAAAGYAALAAIGYASRSDLSGIGAFMLVVLIGLIVALGLNLFFRSTAWDFILACVGLIVFATLIMVDSQRARRLYYERRGEVADEQGLAIVSALALYLDMLNLFLSLLRVIGRDR